MDWFAAVDIYCERTAPRFWNEPLNALSNISFILAAFWAFYEIRKRPGQPMLVWVLTVLCFLIGIGSFLFHTFANLWSELADVIPIWAFVAIYIVASVRIIGGVAPGQILRVVMMVLAVLVIVFLATSGEDVTETAHHTHSVLNGSEQYAPALIAMLVISFLTWKRGHPLARWLIGATLVFLLSLIFRTVDMQLCPLWPHGTHPMWHILNGAMLGLLLQALIRNTDRPE